MAKLTIPALNRIQAAALEVLKENQTFLSVTKDEGMDLLTYEAPPSHDLNKQREIQLALEIMAHATAVFLKPHLASLVIPLLGNEDDINYEVGHALENNDNAVCVYAAYGKPTELPAINKAFCTFLADLGVNYPGSARFKSPQKS